MQQSLRPASQLGRLRCDRYCAGGNLRGLLSDPVLGPPLLWRNRGRRVALDAARGLAYLHSCGVIHRWALTWLWALSGCCQEACAILAWHLSWHHCRCVQHSQACPCI